MEGKTFLLHKRSHLDETLVPVGCCQGLDEIVGAVFGEGINQAALPVKREIFIVNAIFLGVGIAEAQQVSQAVLFADSSGMKSGLGTCEAVEDTKLAKATGIKRVRRKNRLMTAKRGRSLAK